MEEKLTSLIAPLCKEDGIYLLDISIQGGGKDRTVQVVVDTDAGVTLDQCQMLSRKISDLFFQKEIFGDGSYRLEVMSPGVNKDLEAPYEFIRSIGKMLKVKFRENDQVATVTGTLIRYENDSIALQVGETEKVIALKDLKETKIKLKW